MDDKKVTTKWETDGNLAVIYQVGNLLLFYVKQKDPNFEVGEMISRERADETNPYKATLFSWDNVPSDAYISLTWGLQI